MQITEGKVLSIRNLGGIIFVMLLSNNNLFKLVCDRSVVGYKIFNIIKGLKVNNYYSFKTVSKQGELVILELISSIEQVDGNFWSKEKINIVRAYSYMLLVLREYFTQYGYIEVRLPTIHYGQHKKKAFNFDFFEAPARLTTSNALFLNVYAVQLMKVFTIQKCFRVEKSHTNRHLSEFDLLEVAFINKNLKECIVELEKLIKFVIYKFSVGPFMNLVKIDKDLVLNTQFSIVEYEDIAKKYGIGNRGLGKYERVIAESIPTIVIHFPSDIASWVAKPKNDKFSLSFNLLLPNIGEAVEGNEKQTNLSLLKKKFKVAGVEKELGWYVKMMPYSNFLLSGFGLGVERLFMWLLGLKNIREIYPIFRDTRFSEITINTGDNL
ncbi:MAG: hypothetical protein M0P77_09575 [Firmicutes bacterium]|nr:hypothetical protein [Bacillota bacterium]